MIFLVFIEKSFFNIIKSNKPFSSSSFLLFISSSLLYTSIIYTTYI